jgi:citrate lyase subunit beta/citryl-CoA lyase
VRSREATVEWLARRPAWVRVNDAASEHWADDLAALSASPGLLGVMLAKVESAAQVGETAAALAAGTRIVALIESARGIQSVFEIAEHTATFRLAFGSGDFRRDTGIADDPLALAYARSQLVIASAATGIAGPIDGPALDDAALVDAALHARSMGMTGKLTLRLDQVAAINDALSPSADEIGWARDLLARPADSSFDGSYLPALARARALLKLAAAFGLD